jgi:hypothetical protein
MSLGCSTPRDPKAVATLAKHQRQQEAMAELKRNGVPIDKMPETSNQQLLDMDTDYPESEIAAGVRTALDPQVAEAAALVRNGQLPEHAPAFGQSSRTIRRQRVEQVARNAARPEFVSSATATAMRPEDVSNIERLSADDARDVLSRLAIVCPTLVQQAIDKANEVYAWSEGDQRWTLTPHQLRKMRQRKAV